MYPNLEFKLAYCSNSRKKRGSEPGMLNCLHRFVTLENGPLVSKSIHDDKFVEVWRRYKLVGKAAKPRVMPFAVEARFIRGTTVWFG